MENERWLPIAGWVGLYEVSDQGRVRSLDRVSTVSHLKQGLVTATRRGRIMSPGVVQGYLQVSLNDKNKNAQRKVHRLVLEAFVGPCPPGMEGRHIDGVRKNCRLGNLVWGTKVENAADRKTHGTQCLGEGHGRAKITESDVLEIRAAKGAVFQKDLAVKYGIAQSKISAIQRRELWKHVA